MTHGRGMIPEPYHPGHKLEKTKKKSIPTGNHGLVRFHLEITNRVIRHTLLVLDLARLRSFEKNGSFKDAEIFNLDDSLE